MPEILMPRLSDTMEEGSIAKWLKEPGDMIHDGDVIAEVETDKATMDLIAYEDGTLTSIVIPEGASAPIGAVVAVIGEGSTVAKAPVEQNNTASLINTPPANEKDTFTQTNVSNDLITTPSLNGEAHLRIPSSPLARAIARNAGIDLADVRGSGPGGRIVRADVEAVAKNIVDRSTHTSSPTQDRQGHTSTLLPVNKMRKITAERLTEAAKIPQFTLTSGVELTKLNSLRQEINNYLSKFNEKVSVTDILIKACANTLLNHEKVNSSWAEGEGILLHHGVDIGLAVALDEGLVVPVIRGAEQMSLRQIASQTKVLIEKARSKKLTPEEMKGSTFSISNLGPFGIDQFTAILNPPEAAILAVGSANEVPAVRDGQLVIISSIKLTLTLDHRILDGAQGAAFLKDLADALENPSSVLL
jgi:pyruvate dehydrogenase E2 component (dihydrolipoamide acetyltransferase)